MTQEFVISFFRQAMIISIQTAGPVLIVALAVGLVVSVFQAVTQIQEMTLAMIPKMISVILVIFLMFPWFLSKFTEYITGVFESIPRYIGL